LITHTVTNITHVYYRNMRPNPHTYKTLKSVIYCTKNYKAKKLCIMPVNVRLVR